MPLGRMRIADFISWTFVEYAQNSCNFEVFSDLTTPNTEYFSHALRAKTAVRMQDFNSVFISVFVVVVDKDCLILVGRCVPGTAGKGFLWSLIELRHDVVLELLTS